MGHPRQRIFPAIVSLGGKLLKILRDQYLRSLLIPRVNSRYQQRSLCRVRVWPEQFSRTWPQTAGLLTVAGFRTVDDVAYSTVTDLVSIGITPDAAKVLIDVAQDMIEVTPD